MRIKTNREELDLAMQSLVKTRGLWGKASKHRKATPEYTSTYAQRNRLEGYQSDLTRIVRTGTVIEEFREMYCAVVATQR